jgi:hypothetical protein
MSEVITGEPADQAFPQESPPRRGSGIKNCLIGCLIVAVVGLLICGGVAWYVVRNFKTLATNLARQAIVSAVEQSELDPAEKTAVIAEVDRVIDQYRSGQISTEDLAKIMQGLAESPVMGAILVFSIDAKYVQPSGLSDEDKQGAKRTLQRVLRGAAEKKLSHAQIEAALEPVTKGTSEDNRQLKETVTDEELRRFLEQLKQLADEAEIPDEPFEVKISDEFRQAVDRALQKPGA